MHQYNVMTSLLAAHLSSHFLNQNGLLILTGAGGVINNPSHNMIAYSLSKIAVHTLAQNMANSKNMAENSRIITILPKEIDTPQNREDMPKEDFTTWAQTDQIAGLLRMWADGYNLPKNGSFALLNVSNNSIVPEYI
ncbi:quinoid dihydropteridine reductase, putative [Ichthyophthirius multifiliis]|uniref:Quinoid dihydropteridine reductase, putative n=1 Tax=Ichthyophthirius multifiliis TaxID=5932 RepID=G0QY84_ICHMU|nr:quinoid dihydropteridine reductase, putative [Ichthyophthirius multifiliis]EGR29823.1 quinoid dihydropteridine reductase, putative [Ichthyophthirius multifiliis]|eukprot:XP_004031059.1 quinoid dihydropteridine reductase, putative [Ichthyophthirius multifiliis]